MFLPYASNMQCACAILSSVACPAQLYCPTLAHKRHDFRKNFLNIKCVFRFSLKVLSETFFVLRRNEWVMIEKTYIGLHAKCQLFLSNFNETLNFSTDFQKILKYPISWKYFQWEPSPSMQTDRRTVMTLFAILRARLTTDESRNYARILKTIKQPTSHLIVCG